MLQSRRLCCYSLYGTLRQSSSFVAANVQTVPGPSKPRQTRQTAVKRNESLKWKQSIIEELDLKRTRDRKAYGRLQTLRASHAQIIRHAVNGDVSGAISYAHQHLRGVSGGKVNPHDDESVMKHQNDPKCSREIQKLGRKTVIKQKSVMKDEGDVIGTLRFGRGISPMYTLFSIVMLLIARSLSASTTASETAADADASSLCFTFANLWDRMRVLGPNSRAAAVLLWSNLNIWAETRARDESSEEVDRFVGQMALRLQRMLRHEEFVKPLFVLCEKDRKQLDDAWEHLITTDERCERVQWKHERTIDAGYDPELRLIDPLRQPVSKEEYLGNPYNHGETDKVRYMNLFSDHFDREKTSWLRVENYCKTASGSRTSAEELLTSWNWPDRIAKSIDKLKQERIQYPLKGYLSVINSAELAALLFESCLALCCMGQNLVAFSNFQYHLVAPVLRLLHEKFVQKLGVDEKALWTSVFDDYVEYFCDSEVSRTHTHRQWWEKCCSRRGVDPSYQNPMSEFHSETRKQLANFLIQVVLEACVFPHTDRNSRESNLAAFSIRNVSVEEDSHITDEPRSTPSRMVKLERRMLAALEDAQFDYILFPTHELPMTVPPRPWCDGGRGGPEFTRRADVLRSLVEYRTVDVNKQMTDRLKSKMQGRPVWDALNQLGSTPWIINEPMLEVLCQVFQQSDDVTKKDLLETLSVPRRAATVIVPDFIETFGAGANMETVEKEKYREYGKAKAAAVKERNELNSLWYWMMYRVVLARHFRGQVLYFPHNMDFRGRVYPISPYLSHMGDDINRCMLKFAKGKALGPKGLSWLKLHCINLTGKLKRQSVVERLVEAERVLPDIIDSANKPLDGGDWWMQSEEPWQTLAACIELRDALNHPGNVEDYVSHLAVHQDGSCNGLQHYAALGRDRQGGMEVNLLSSDSPNDVYSSVAQRVEVKRLEDEKAEGGANYEVSTQLRLAMPHAVPRKVIKQTVMTTVYGVTMYGAKLQIRRQLKATGIDNEALGGFSTYLAVKTFNSLHDAFTCSMQLKDWLRNCAKGTNELLRTMEWVTPLGLPVVQPYLKTREVTGKVILAPVPGKQIDAFPPNLVHSLDSTHMMLTTLDCSRRGVTFAAVHDCFWTHAASVDRMNETCREQFVRLHQQPLVEQLSDYLQKEYLPVSITEKMSPAEQDRIRNIFRTQVEQGELDIKDVMESVYFFS